MKLYIAHGLSRGQYIFWEFVFFKNIGMLILDFIGKNRKYYQGFGGKGL